MGILKHLFKPKEIRQFERALKDGRYEEALARYGSGHIAAPIKAEAQYKLMIYEAASSVSLNPPFQEEIEAVASAIQNPAIINALPDSEQSVVQLAHMADTLKNGALEDALGKSADIKNKEARAQALRKVASHMACQGQPLDKTVQVITAIPIAAYANEELRNLLLSKILLKDFDAARRILPHIDQEIRRGLRPQIDFVERNHDDLKDAQIKARDLIHPDDISLTLALVAGAMGNYGRMSHFSRSVSTQLLVGTHTTYSISLAYADKLHEAVSLLDNIQTDGHTYFLRLGYLAFNFPYSGQKADMLRKAFATAEHYEGALGYWYHQILGYLVSHDITRACDAIRTISNQNLRKALAVLIAEFAYTVKTALHTI